MSYIAHEQAAVNHYLNLGKPSAYMGEKKEDSYLNKLLTEENLPSLYSPAIPRMQDNGLYSSRNKSLTNYSSNQVQY